MWHKKCFNCAECHRPLDSTLACDGPDREVHCRACYAKLFGPKGFGFGHTPTLMCADGAIAPVVHDPRPNSGPKAAPGQGCKRCGYAVFAAEQMVSKSGIFHKRYGSNFGLVLSWICNLWKFSGASVVLTVVVHLTPPTRMTLPMVKFTAVDATVATLDLKASVSAWVLALLPWLKIYISGYLFKLS